MGWLTLEKFHSGGGVVSKFRTTLRGGGGGGWWQKGLDAKTMLVDRNKMTIFTSACRMGAELFFLLWQKCVNQFNFQI